MLYKLLILLLNIYICSWTGPKQYKKFNARHKSSDDRPGFTPPIKHTRTCSKQESVTPCIEPTPEKSSFHTPYKKKRVPEHSDPDGTGVAQFQTPFRTPVKPGITNQSNVAPVVKETDIVIASSNDIANTDPEPAVPSSDCVNNEAAEIPESLCTITDDVKKSRLKAKVAQAQDIQRTRKSGDTRPVAGQLYTKKNNGNQMTLKEAFEGYRPRSYTKKQVCLYSIES